MTDVFKRNVEREVTKYYKNKSCKIFDLGDQEAVVAILDHARNKIARITVRFYNLEYFRYVRYAYEWAYPSREPPAGHHKILYLKYDKYPIDTELLLTKAFEKICGPQYIE